MQCLEATDCPGGSDECTLGVCVNGTCDLIDQPISTPCTRGGVECNGNGTCTSCPGKPLSTRHSFLQNPPLPGYDTDQYADIVATDLDGDGDVDLAVASAVDGLVSVFSNLGDGAYAAPTQHSIPLANDRIAAGDLDGDGSADLIVWGSTSSFTVLTSLGGGSFSEGVGVSPGEPGTILELSTGDLNGDQLVDIAAIAYSGGNKLFVFLNDGAGGFTSPLSGPVGTGEGNIEIADLNGDSMPDVATVGYDDLLVHYNLGGGSLGAPVAFPAGSSIESIAVAIADFDGDGSSDVAVTNESDGDDAPPPEVAVLFNDGAGVFGSPVMLACAGGCEEILTTDVNADGHPDIVVGDPYSDVGVFMNQGDGSFGAIAVYPCPRGSALAAADLNGDEKLDLAAPVFHDDTFLVRILLNSEHGFSPAPRRELDAPFRAVSVADFTGDGIPDIAAGGDALSVLPGLGDGTFGAPIHSSMAAEVLWITSGDLNGDGATDIAGRTEDAVALLFNQGSGSFDAPVYFPAPPTDHANIVASDMNGDGALDLITESKGTVSVRLNLGRGVFGEPEKKSAGMDVEDFTVGDADNDGKPDIAIVGHEWTDASSDQSIILLLGAGDGGFTKSFVRTVNEAHGIVLADFDGDGRSDIAVTEDDAALVMRGKGDGLFEDFGEYAARGARPVQASDIDTDGHLDLVFDSQYHGIVSTLYNEGDGTFKEPVRLGTGGGRPAVPAADLDGDGRPDLVIEDHESISVVLNTCLP